jgi:hypothetical protein
MLAFSECHPELALVPITGKLLKTMSAERQVQLRRPRNWCMVPVMVRSLQEQMQTGVRETPSVITSKAAMRDHFKTGQMSHAQDLNLF